MERSGLNRQNGTNWSEVEQMDRIGWNGPYRPYWTELDLSRPNGPN